MGQAGSFEKCNACYTQNPAYKSVWETAVAEYNASCDTAQSRPHRPDSEFFCLCDAYATAEEKCRQKIANAHQKLCINCVMTSI